MITKEMASGFMADIRGMATKGKENVGVMSAALVAQHLCIDEEKANEYLWAAVRYGLSDRANGMFVI